MLKNIIKIGLSCYSIYEMAKFARPKLMAYDISVKTFTYLGEKLHISGELFMYFTGIVEAIIALLLGVSLVALLTGRHRHEVLFGTAGSALLFCTMAVALLCEFFVRPTPVNHLVVLGSTLVLVSVFQLLLLNSPRLFPKAVSAVTAGATS